MTIHFQREIEHLKERIVSLGNIVEKRVEDAVRAVLEVNRVLAEKLISGDVEVDAEEVALEEECLKVLALYQPVAVDLRVVVSVLKINNDLERIGDLAVNIAQRAEGLSLLGRAEEIPDILTMAEKAKWMVRESLRSFVALDAQIARRVRASDRQIDELNRAMYANISQWIVEDPTRTPALLLYLSVSKHLERIADHATNIAEDVIYLTEGDIVRHRVEFRGRAQQE